MRIRHIIPILLIIIIALITPSGQNPIHSVTRLDTYMTLSSVSEDLIVVDHFESRFSSPKEPVETPFTPIIIKDFVFSDNCYNIFGMLVPCL